MQFPSLPDWLSFVVNYGWKQAYVVDSVCGLCCLFSLSIIPSASHHLEKFSRLTKNSNLVLRNCWRHLHSSESLLWIRRQTRVYSVDGPLATFQGLLSRGVVWSSSSGSPGHTATDAENDVRLQIFQICYFQVEVPSLKCMLESADYSKIFILFPPRLEQCSLLSSKIHVA